MINQFGNVYEGCVTPDGKLNGFGIVYNGHKRKVDFGFYKNNKWNGDLMSVELDDMSVRT